MSNSTNMLVHFDEKHGNLCLRLRIFHPVKFEQTKAHQRVLLRRASVIEGIAVCLFVCLMVFNATFNNISILSWRSVLLVEETGESGENHRPVSSH